MIGDKRTRWILGLSQQPLASCPGRPSIRGPHHSDVHLDTFEPVDAVYPRALDRHLAFERREDSDRGCKVVDDAANVVPIS